MPSAKDRERLHFFNRLARGVGILSRQGRSDKNRDEMLARVARFPGGEALLQQAAALGCDIAVRPRREVGVEGTFDHSNGKLVIKIANTGDTAGMAITLWHELRHLQQHAANPPAGVAGGGQLKDPRTAHMMGIIVEADAFTAETLMALQQKKAGHPEYYDAMFKKSSDGAHRDILRFLRDHPYESFRDDATFARGLFTHLMMDGLLGYRANYFAWLGANFAASETADDFRKLVNASKPGGTEAGPEWAALYGGTMTAPRALATAFLGVQPADEQKTLELIEDAVARAPKMTDAEFQAAKKEVLSHTREIWQKDPDESWNFHTPAQEEARKRLTKAALENSPQVK